MKKIQVKRYEFDEVHIAEYNPRDISREELDKLKESISTYGLVQPIIVNTKTMNIVGGNQRVSALLELGETGADMVEIELTEAEEKSLNLALNKISGDWDMNKLSALLGDISDDDFITGFDDIEIEAITGIDTDISLDDWDYEDVEYSDDLSDSGSGGDITGDTPAKRYVVYVSFKDKAKAELFLKHHGIKFEFKGRNRETVIDEDELNIPE